ncbi:nucleotidyltransferase domain-containing protein [Pseudoduganella sp. UC29_71]|jgi:proline iminopeptidase|uniref:nucleotidyltransferase domain-containing protein n=1 Tax=Pseudoduganella sp. UC29_71 TaxID=3350174 RepID=UPI0036719981
MDHLAETRFQFGLSERIVDSLRAVFARYPMVRKAVVCGSRAVGSHWSYSDIDIAVMAPTMQERDFSAL